MALGRLACRTFPYKGNRASYPFAHPPGTPPPPPNTRAREHTHTRARAHNFRVPTNRSCSGDRFRAKIQRHVGTALGMCAFGKRGSAVARNRSGDAGLPQIVRDAAAICLRDCLESGARGGGLQGYYCPLLHAVVRRHSPPSCFAPPLRLFCKGHLSDPMAHNGPTACRCVAGAVICDALAVAVALRPEIIERVRWSAIARPPV